MKHPVLSILGGIAFAGVAGAVGYFATERLLSNPRKSLSCPDGEHVGAHGFDWPAHRELFLDAAGFGEALETFGYETDLEWVDDGWSPCDESFRGYVESFQKDWNRIRVSIPDAPGALETTGLIDRKTIEAMAFVHGLQASGESWLVLVIESSP